MSEPMDEATYARLAHTLERVGLSRAEIMSLRTAAELRHDARVEVLCALAVGDEARAAEIATAATAVGVRSIVAMVGAWKNVDSAWHLLFHIGETHRDTIAEVEAAVADWRDEARVVPNRWWAEIDRGKHEPYHLLVRNVSLEGDHAHVLERPTARASLRRVTLLGLSHIDDVGLALACAAGLDDVRTLEVSNSELAATSIADLIVGASFPALRSLVLSGLSSRIAARPFAEAVSDDPMPLELVAAALAGRSTQRPRFDLELRGLGVDAEALRPLVREPALRGVATLGFSFSVIGPEEIAIVARGEHTSQLTGISLHLGEIGPTGARSLLGAPFARNLRTLSLPNQGITDVLGELLAGQLSACERLELRWNGLGARTAAAIATADLGHLETLELSYNDFTDHDLAAVLRNPTLRVLERLELIGTGAGEETARALADSLQLGTLRALNIGDAFGDAATNILSSATALRGLRRLQLIGTSDVALSQLRSTLELHLAHVTNARFA